MSKEWIADTAPTGDSQNYDANGNRTSGDYSVGSDNQMATDGAGYSYAYDAQGNRTWQYVGGWNTTNNCPDSGDTQVTQYTWDNRNRLVKVDHFSTYTGAGSQDWEAGSVCQVAHIGFQGNPWNWQLSSLAP